MSSLRGMPSGTYYPSNINETESDDDRKYERFDPNSAALYAATR